MKILQRRISKSQYLIFGIIALICGLGWSNLSAITFNNVGMVILSKQYLAPTFQKDNYLSRLKTLMYAKKNFEEAQSLYPSSWHWKLNLARQLFLSHDLNTAINNLESIPASSPDFFQARSLLADIYIFKGEWKQAVEIWKSIGGGGPINKLAIKYRDEGEKEIALELFQAAVEVNPNLTDSWVDLGWLRYEVNKDITGAISAIKQAIVLQPGRSYPYCLLCQIYFETGDYDLASLFAQQITTQFPDEACGWDYQARIFKDLGRVDELEFLLKDGISHLPSNAVLHDQLANVYYYQRRYPEAIQEWKTAVQLSPETWWYYSHLGEGYFEIGDLDQALVIFTQALALQPNNDYLQEMVSQIEKEIQP